MASFICICNSCEKKLKRKMKRLRREWTKDEYEEGVLFETAHSIKATDEQIKEALTCPRCDGQDCQKTLMGYNITGYVRGNGYLDKEGCKRDMNLFHLTQDDPYGEYRQPGEVEEIKTKLQRGGRHKPRAKTFDVGGAVKKAKSMKKAVEDAAKQPPVTPPPPSIPSE